MKRKKQTPVPCKYPGCVELVRDGSYCSKHKHQAAGSGGRRREPAAWHGLYYTKSWRELRTVQLIKEPFCRICAEAGIRTPAEDVDHIIPHRGDMMMFCDMNNLQSLCHSCHSRKTAAETAGGSPPPKNVF